MGTVLYLMPAEGIAIAVLCNSSKQTAAVLGDTLGDIISVLLPSFGQQWKARRAQRQIEADNQDGGASGTHVGNALASWMELRR